MFGKGWGSSCTLPERSESFPTDAANFAERARREGRAAGVGGGAQGLLVAQKYPPAPLL